MSLLILKKGLLDSIQDAGRVGYSKWGINEGGVMDWYAYRIAQALVGSNYNAPVLEMHFPAAQILFKEDVLISLTGADFTPTIDDVDVPLWKPVLVRRNAVLTFKAKRNGQVCYLALQNSLAVDVWLNSASTNFTIQRGGWKGRALQKGDEIFYNPSTYSFPNDSLNVMVLPWHANSEKVYSDKNVFVLKGHEWSWLDDDGQRLMSDEQWFVSAKSDRMGYYLSSSSKLSFKHKEELISSGVTMGTIQALPNGEIVALMADHQTTGGYLRVSHIITAHLPNFVQRQPNETVMFRETSIEHAEKMLVSMHHDLEILRRACHYKLQEYYAKHRS